MNYIYFHIKNVYYIKKEAIMNKKIRKNILLFCFIFIFIFVFNNFFFRGYIHPDKAVREYLKIEKNIKEIKSMKNIIDNNYAVYIFKTEKGLRNCVLKRKGLFWVVTTSSNIFVSDENNQVQYNIISLANSEKSIIYGASISNDIIKIQVTLDNNEKYCYDLDSTKLFMIEYIGYTNNFKKIEGLDISDNIVWYHSE